MTKLRALHLIENRRVYLTVYKMYLNNLKKPTITIPVNKDINIYLNVGKKRKSSFTFHSNQNSLEDLEGKLKRLRKLSGNSDIYTNKCANLIAPIKIAE